MLVLTRKIGESIIINENIELVVIETVGDSVRIGINAPRHVPVYRKEVFQSIQEANRLAAATDMVLNAELQEQLSKSTRKKKNKE